MTALGGAVWVPMAVRSSDSTTAMRTKLVTMMRMERHRQDGDERDELDDALVHAGALAEIDRDVLRDRRPRDERRRGEQGEAGQPACRAGVGPAGRGLSGHGRPAPGRIVAGV